MARELGGHGVGGTWKGPPGPPGQRILPPTAPVMRRAVNHSGIGRDRLSLPETIYWIPRSKRGFFLFSSVFSGAIEKALLPPGPAGRPLFLAFTHENSFLGLPTSLLSPFPQCLPKPPFPPLFIGYTKPTSCFQRLTTEFAEFGR